MLDMIVEKFLRVLGFLDCKFFLIKKVMYIGWFRRLVLRLDIVRFKSNVFKGFDNEEVFYSV